MNRITIREQDLTTPEVGSLSSTDVVYVPGFSAVDSTDRTIGLPNEPTLCKTVAEFENAFGKFPVTFSADQAYPSGVDGFPAVAIPTVESIAQPMFKAGDNDPSYIYAKELIAAGIPVLYERLNSDLGYYYLGEAVADPTSGTPSATIEVYIDKTATPPTKKSVTASKYGFVLYSSNYYIWNGTDAWTNNSTVNPSEVTVANFYSAMATKFDSTSDFCILVEKGEYQFKYLTTGGYPSFEYGGINISQKMVNLCAKRGDAVALIDHTNNPGRVLTGTNSVYDNAISQTYTLENASYAAMFTPWANYNLVASYGTVTITNEDLPGSFAYLKALAASLRNNPNWLVIAGVSRGKVPSLAKPDTNYILTNSIADSYQSDGGVTSINAVTNITPYGQCIMGNRTLLDTSSQSGLIATSYLNIRNIASDIKKQLYLACKSLLFEQNTDVLWCDFLSMVTPLLDNMQSGHGIAGYRVNKSSESTKTKIVAVVTIYPVYAVESFDITVVLRDDELSTTEE